MRKLVLKNYKEIDGIKIFHENVDENHDDYNYNRPHTILNKLSPVEYLEQYNLNANYSDLSCPN